MSEPQEFRHILVVEDRKGRRVFSLEKSNYTMGRDNHNAIVIYDYQVSRIHATLVKKIEDTENDFCYCIIDGDLQGKRSTNGLIINGKLAISHDLKHADTIKFAQDAKATYYIVSTDSGIDLFNPDDLDKINVHSSSIIEESKQTLIAKPEEPEKSTHYQDQEELIRLASFPELSPNPIIEIDWEGNLTYLNPAASIKFENIYDQKLEHPILAGLLTEYNNRQGNLFLREVKIGLEVFEQYVHYLSEKKLIRSYIFDFTKRKQVEVSLKESESRYRAVVRQTSEGVFLAYANNKKIMETNDAFCELLGYTDQEILQFTLYNVISGDIPNLKQDLDTIFQDKDDLVTEYLYRCKDGSLINLESSISLISYRGKDIFCFVVRNLSIKKQVDDNLSYQIFHDLLTQLPNQKLFNEQLNIAIANAKRYQYLMAVIVVEIENLEKFKELENNIQIEQFLQNFSQGFKSCLRSGDFPARWDEDKFMAILFRIRGPKDPAKIAKRMSEILKKYMRVENPKIELKLNIGMVVYPLDGEDNSTLIKNALSSLEQSKKPNFNNYGISGFTITPKTATLLKVENLISNAIKEQQFFLTYQPQINLKTRKLTGIEALLKWEDSDLLQLAPRHFFKLTEETDLMLPLNKWILQSACMQNKVWIDAGLPSLPIGVNLSVRQFQQPNLVEMISEILEETKLPPKQLELEITEACLMQNPEWAAQTLLNFSEMGVKICLDDFGIGNSSLSYFEQFRFNTVKISPTLIAQMTNETKRNAIISAIVTLSHGFDFRIVAEGVETKQQMEILIGLECQQIQGNLFTRPLTSQDTSNFLKRGDHTILN